jgi:Glycosyl transferase family 21
MSILILIAVVGGGLLTSVLALAATVVFVLKLEKPRSQKTGVATLILPMTGRVPNLERLLAALNGQTLPARRLLLAIESEQDPAFDRARALLPFGQLAIEIVLTGTAQSTAQKCWNQTAALRRIDARDEVIVLLDADILPPPWWLSALVSPLVDDVCDVVTGYRWLRVEKPSLWAHVLAAIDRSIAVLPRAPFTGAPWGGTLALSRRALETLELPTILASVLADDCSIGQAAVARDLRILTRRALLVASPLQVGLSQAWQFGRRQYQIAHLYLPKLYWLALAGIAARLIAWCAILWTWLGHGYPLLAGALALLFIALALASYAGQQMVARRLGIGDSWQQALVQAGLAIAKPAVDVFHASLLMAALYYRRVRWGHVVYRVDGPRDLEVEKRLPWQR